MLYEGFAHPAAAVFDVEADVRIAAPQFEPDWRIRPAGINRILGDEADQLFDGRTITHGPIFARAVDFHRVTQLEGERGARHQCAKFDRVERIDLHPALSAQFIGQLAKAIGA